MVFRVPALSPDSSYVTLLASSVSSCINWGNIHLKGVMRPKPCCMGNVQRALQWFLTSRFLKRGRATLPSPSYRAQAEQRNDMETQNSSLCEINNSTGTVHASGTFACLDLTN